MLDDQREALELFDRGYERQRAGALEDAVLLYQASIARFPTAEAHTFLGWVYSFDRRFGDAIAECKRAIAVDPSFGNPYNDIGVYLLELNRPGDAVVWFQKAMQAVRYDAPQLTRASEKMPGEPSVEMTIRRLQARVN